MKLPPTKAASGGFTLLEMLIVLVLLSILMVVLTSTIFMGITARARVTAVALDQDDCSSLRRILLQQLGLAYPDWITNGQSGSIDFDGSSTGLVFLAPALETQGLGISRYSLMLGNQQGRKNLTLQTTLSTYSQGPTLTTHFAAGLASFKLEYFGPPGDGGAAIWQNDWVMRSTLPDLVAVQVTFPKGDHRSWPTMIIHPSIDADVTCEIDPETHRCQGR